MTTGLGLIGLALGVIGLFKEPLAGAIILAAIILAFSLLGFYGFILRTRMGDPYEVIESEDCWDLVDDAGQDAWFVRTRQLRFLQDSVSAVREAARGDGRITEDYDCTPYKKADEFWSGGWHNVVISLRETKRRGDELPLTVKRHYLGSFTKSSESVDAMVTHDTRKHSIRVVFPADRPPKDVWFTRSSNTNRREPLTREGLNSGRQQVVKTIPTPRRGETYTISWDW